MCAEPNTVSRSLICEWLYCKIISSGEKIELGLSPEQVTLHMIDISRLLKNSSVPPVVTCPLRPKYEVPET